MKNIMKKMLKKIGLYNEFVRIYIYIEYTINKVFYYSDKKKMMYIKKIFKKNLGYDVNFDNEPITYNQKIQFRKLFDDNPLYSICADKYRVREYVKEKIGEEYLIPLYLVTDKLTIEQWKKLPNSFVAKANHNSGPVQIVKDKSKVDAKKIIKELNNQLKIDYGVLSMEKYYSDIPRKIVVEKYLEHSNDTIEDFKFHIFNTQDIFIEHIYERKNNQIFECFYDKNWNRIDIAIGAKIYNHRAKKPQNYEEMLEIAIKLAEDFEYARIDLYNIEGKIYFGEITFCGDSGFGKFTDEKWDYKFGEFWNQPKLK